MSIEPIARNPEGAPPEWLIATTPGASEARDRWRAADDEVRRAGADLTRAQRALGQLTRWDTEGNRVPARGVSVQEVDEARLAIEAARIPVAEASSSARAALRAFHSLFAEASSEDGQSRRQLAATHARRKHTEAEAAWASLVVALAERDEAWAAAGRPGRAWTSLDGTSGRLDGGLGDALRILEIAVRGFDLDAVARVAESGEPVDTYSTPGTTEIRKGSVR